MKKIGISMKKIEKISLIYGAILASLFSLSLYIRAALPYKSVFGGPFVGFGGNDPWYHMRIVENTLYNFPYRIWYDAFTYYPHGGYNPFAPLFDYFLSVIIWIIGLGNPYATLGQHGIEVIGAWYPAVLGALVIIPVYLVGKEIYNRNVGLFAAGLIAVLPGPSLTRTILGFTDHDVGGILLNTIAIYFFVLALKHAKENRITFESILNKDWKTLKKPITYTILAGITFGSFHLEWVGGMLFGYVVFAYVVIQYIVDHVRGESTDYLCIIGVPLYLIALVMIIPFLHPYSVEASQVTILCSAMIAFLVMSGLSVALVKKGITPYGYPFAVIGTAIIALVLLNVLNPSLYSRLTGILGLLTPSPGELTIAEAHPMRVFGTSLAFPGAWEWFTTTFFVAFAAFPWIGYNIARRFRPEEILLLVWSAVVLIGCFGQNRFAFFYAVNVALLCGFISWKIIELVGFRDEEGFRAESAAKNKVKGKGEKKGGARAKTLKNKPKAKAKVKVEKTNAEKIKRYLRAEVVFTFVIIFFVVFYLPLFSTPEHGRALGSLYPRGAGGPDYDWYESLSWMRNNTPEPGVSYYDLYEEPPRGVDYDYPEEAYGVMSWWDYGHWITRIARRIPNANPFQWGIGGPGENGTIRPGACMFLTATDEEEANWILDELGTRYVVSDFMMADAFNAFYNKFGAITSWAGRGYPDYYHTTELRLHMFDGASVEVEGENIAALAHYRLVHESPTFILPMIIMNQTTGRGYWRSMSGDYNRMKSQAQILHGYLFSMPMGVGIEDVLDNESIPEILSSVFNSTGIPLSEDSTVVKSDENGWTIRDEINKNMFTINKREGKLDVYLYGVKTGQPNVKAWTPEYIQPVSFVKTFEYVKGARIEGTAPNGSVVEIATNVTTNQGREFVYAERMMSNGTYEFIVPYSTEGPIEGGTNFDVFASPYKIRAGDEENATVMWDVEKEISVPEEAVMEGKTIRVDLLS